MNADVYTNYHGEGVQGNRELFLLLREKEDNSNRRDVKPHKREKYVTDKVPEGIFSCEKNPTIFHYPILNSDFAFFLHIYISAGLR